MEKNEPILTCFNLKGQFLPLLKHLIFSLPARVSPAGRMLLVTAQWISLNKSLTFSTNREILYRKAWGKSNNSILPSHWLPWTVAFTFRLKIYRIFVCVNICMWNKYQVTDHAEWLHWQKKLPTGLQPICAVSLMVGLAQANRGVWHILEQRNLAAFLLEVLYFPIPL